MQFRSILPGILALGLGLLACQRTLWAEDPLTASGNDPEQFHLEVTGSGWLVNSGGNIQSNGTPINLVTDLGVAQQQPTFWGNLVFKPARRHRFSSRARHSGSAA